MKRVALLLLLALSARADEVAQGLENLANIFRIAQYLELKRVVAEVPELPPAIDPWGNAYLVDPAAGRIVGAGSDGRFDRDRTEPEQFTGLEGDVVFANGNFVRTNHNWLCARVTAASEPALAQLRRAEMLLLMSRTERARTMMPLHLTMQAMQNPEATAATRDAWGTPLRVIEENGTRRVISAGADRTFDPMSWSRPPALDAREDIVLENGTFVRRVDAKALDETLDGDGEPLPQPLERALRDQPGTPYLPVRDGVKAPVATSRVEPVYPESYRRLGISGIIILELAISETGTIDHIATLKSLGPALDAAAIDAVRKWTFTAGTRDGKPVPTLFNLTINFKLN